MHPYNGLHLGSSNSSRDLGEIILLEKSCDAPYRSSIAIRISSANWPMSKPHTYRDHDLSQRKASMTMLMESILYVDEHSIGSNHIAFI